MGYQVAWFFGLTLAFAWGVPVGALFLARVFGFDPPQFSAFTPLVAWSPAFAALTVIAITRGIPGLQSFFHRLARWPMNAGWYVFALAGIPAACLIASLLTATEGQSRFGRPDGRWGAMVLDALLRAAATPVAEFGLRGFAQPMLQRRHGAIEASVIIGVMWTVWLLPTFMLAPGFASPQGPAPDLQLLAFAVRAIALSVILGVVYNRTHGSIPVCVLVHWTATLAYPGEGAAGALPAQALVFTVLAFVLGVTLRGGLRPGTLERHVTRLPSLET
jgi:hypothetical protein